MAARHRHLWFARPPTQAFDFINNPTSALSILTFTRASSATYFTSAGLLQTASNNVARLDYDPATLASLGLLLEEARTNVVLWNRDLTNAAWTKSNVTATLTATGIDGAANSASTLTATAGNGTVLQAITLASSARFQTAWIKRRTGTGTINMTMDNGSTWTDITSSIGSGSYLRCSIPTQTLANPTVGFRIVTNGDAIDVDYVQNENGVFATSSIATTTASVPRAIEVCTLLTSAIAGFNATLGTLVAIGSPEGQSLNNRAIARFDDGTNNNVIGLFHNGANGTFVPKAFVAVANVNQAVLNPATPWGVGTVRKLALAYTTDDFAFAVDGAIAGTDNSGSIPTVTTLEIGRRPDITTENWCGHITYVGYYNQRLGNAQIQAITT